MGGRTENESPVLKVRELEREVMEIACRGLDRRCGMGPSGRLGSVVTEMHFMQLYLTKDNNFDGV